MFDLILLSLPHIRSGALRGLAVTSAKRLPTLPDLPPVADFVPGYEAFAWQGVAAPKNTPPDIVAKLNARDQRRSRRCQDRFAHYRPRRRRRCRCRPPSSAS